MERKSKLIYLFFGLIFSMFISSNVEAATNDMYRLYNPNSGEHFYTKNSKERDLLKRVGWNDEGIGWYAPTNGEPVYRVYNPNAGDHHYTPHKFERDHLVNVGWRYEGIGWYSDKNKTVPLYRAYNPNAKAGSHNYTVSKAEQNHLIKVGWRNENIAWYGAKRESTSAPIVNKKELQALYDKTKGTNKGDYSEKTWKAFQNALSNATNVLSKKNATQKEVDDARSTLQNAFNGLKSEPKLKSFTVQAEKNGSIKGTESGNYSEGTQISVTAVPDPGYKFKAWSTTTGLPPGTNVDNETLNFTMPENTVTLVAEFEALTISGFSVQAGRGGSIEGTESGNYSEGTQISVTAKPNKQFRFIGWTTTTGLPPNTNNDRETISFTMPANDVTLVAEFDYGVIYELGDYYPDPKDSTTAEGRVFETSEGGLNIKYVVLEPSVALQWGKNNDIFTGQNSETNGAFNLNKYQNLRDFNNHPLFEWVDSLNGVGATYRPDGDNFYYVPSKQELQAIRDIGINIPSNTWSSTESTLNSQQAWSYQILDQKMMLSDKRNAYPTYAVKFIRQKYDRL